MTTTTTLDADADLDVGLDFDFDAAVASWWLVASGAPHDRLRHGGAIAVVGAGSGLTAVRLARALPHVTVSMISPDAGEAESASGAARDAGVAARCSFAAGGPEDLPAARYDLVCLIHVVRGATDPAATLRRAGRVMAPDGTLVIVEPAPPTATDIDIARDAETLTTLLARVGLADVELVAGTGRHLELRARRAP